jgi:NADPH:quinone reductase-like Zn-dependent oxidoreductase
VKAIRISQFGSPDVLDYVDEPVPHPKAGEAVVEVHAAGVGPWDAWMQEGKTGQALPFTPGSDLSGIVRTVGAGVTSVAPGEAVYGVTNSMFTGAYAEYAAAECGRLAPKPRTLTDVEAAAVPVVAVTAWQMLFEHARTEGGHTVLVHGAAGNVGSFVVQFARWKGARVIATASAKDTAYVRALGADDIIDYSRQQFDAMVKDVDAVFDTVGGETLERSIAVIRAGGIIVSSVAPPDAAEAARRSVRTAYFLVDVTTDRLRHITSLLESGAARTTVGSVIPLSEARRAHSLLTSTTRPRGKIVLQVAVVAHAPQSPPS